jgi:hypothetical protein
VKLPTVLTTTVVRGAKDGMHGELYILDLEDGHYETIIRFDEPINFVGSGGERGLRGIAFYNDYILIGLYRSILILDRDFTEVDRIYNQYLLDCHELFVHNDHMYVVSTLFDSILVFDLINAVFVDAICFRKGLMRHFYYDPQIGGGPPKKDTIHLNNVYVDDQKLVCSGRNCINMLCLEGEELMSYAKIPLMTHNARPLDSGIIYNDTAKYRLAYCDGFGNMIFWNAPSTGMEIFDTPSEVARAGFCRGLCVCNDLIIGGSSFATISVYKRGQFGAIRSIRMSESVRHTIHGLMVWPPVVLSTDEDMTETL